MSSASGDETEVALTDPVHRTRSGRARKTTVVAKKSPVKKLLARATRSPKKVQEIEEIEEEESILQEGVAMESIPENGVQRFNDIIIEQHSEEDTPMLHLELEDSGDTTVHEINMNQSVQMERDEENVLDLENPPPQVEHSNTVPDSIIIEESSIDKVEMLSERGQIEIEEQDTSNDDTNQRVLIDFQEVINEDGDTMTQVTEILETEEVESENPLANRNAAEEIMEVDETEQVVSESVEESEKLEPEEATMIETIDQSAIEITEVSETDLGRLAENNIKKTEPDTEAVSEDELPTEAAAKEPETEAVSDEELPAAATADLGETESVSEDELPPDSEKKKKIGGKAMSKTPEKKSKAEGSNKRKLNAEGEYDPSSPTSENNDETPAKKVALSAEADAAENKQEAKPASPKKKTLPELEKYWKAVNEDPSDFTGWTYLLQYVDQENDAEAAREAYTKFLERYPYCYGYWRKFADYEKKKGDPENVQTVSQLVYHTYLGYLLL